MARIRTIKPEFPQSETMGRVSRDARLLFIQIWTLADDHGRARASSRLLASLLYPYDDDARALLPGWLDELEDVGAIRLYVVNGDAYLEVCNWLKHQKIDKPSGPKCPGFAEGSPRTREASAGDRDRDPYLDQDPEGIKPSLSAAPTAVDVPRETRAMVEAAAADLGTDPEDVRAVFEHWRVVWGHPRAVLDEKRRKLIRARLKGYSVADLCLAISGYRNSPHHRGQNDRATVYDDIGLLLRDSAHVDAGLSHAKAPPRADQSALTRKNVAAVADWVPPEMRGQRAAG